MLKLSEKSQIKKYIPCALRHIKHSLPALLHSSVSEAGRTGIIAIAVRSCALEPYLIANIDVVEIGKHAEKHRWSRRCFLQQQRYALVVDSPAFHTPAI